MHDFTSFSVQGLTSHTTTSSTTDAIHNITYTTSICVPGQLEFTGYINRFRMPSEESGGVGNFWYCFDHGLAHFIVFNTETDSVPVGLVSPDGVGGIDAGANNGPFGYPNEQYDWFEKDLASVDRDKTPWIVVGLHRPWYIGIQNDSSADVCLRCQQAFEPLMIKYGVDLYMQGHVHAYERNAPMLGSPTTLSIPTDSTTHLHPGTSSTVPRATTTVSTRSSPHSRTGPSTLLTPTLYKAHHFSNGNGC